MHLNICMNIVWWNGPSQQQWLHIPRQQLEIGCNFIEQHRSVDHVCAFDRQCVDLIAEQAGVQYWTRRRCVGGHFQLLDSVYPYYDSGMMALVLAIESSTEPVYVIGCDWANTNASMYDSQYTWRRHQPAKLNPEKVRAINRMAAKHPIVMVHDNLGNIFGADVARIGPKRFRELCD